jgi:hypothetical protein
MTAIQRALIRLLAQVSLTGFAVYVGLFPDALPGASTAARAGLAVLFVAVALLFSEVAQVRQHMSLLLSTIQSGLASGPKDHRKAVDVLVAALESPEARVRGAAHRNLVRITGRDLPEDAAAWKAWWGGARADFQPPAGA